MRLRTAIDDPCHSQISLQVQRRRSWRAGVLDQDFMKKTGTWLRWAVAGLAAIRQISEGKY